MITLEKVDGATLEAEAEKAGITLPIEQTKVWSGFQADIDGRTPWGDYLIKRDGELVAVISFIDFETHGYHYLRSMHGPAWVAKPTEAEEREVVDAIVDTVKKADKNIAFLRIDTWFADGTEKVLSTVPYDQTVVIDLEGVRKLGIEDYAVEVLAHEIGRASSGAPDQASTNRATAAERLTPYSQCTITDIANGARSISSTKSRIWRAIARSNRPGSAGMNSSAGTAS